MGKPLSALVLLVAVSVCPRLEAASVYPNCADGTLQSYKDSSVCVLGAADVVVGFAFPAPLNPDGASVLGASQIEVTPVSNGLGGSFDFAGSFSVAAGDTVTYNIDYILVFGPGSILGGASMFLDPSGNVSATETICPDSFFGTASGGATVCQANTPDGLVDSAPQVLSVNDGNPPSGLSASITLSPPAYSYANVEMAIVLTGGASGATSGGVVTSVAVQSLSDIPAAPEPGTSLLCFGGLATIGAIAMKNGICHYKMV